MKKVSLQTITYRYCVADLSSMDEFATVIRTLKSLGAFDIQAIHADPSLWFSVSFNDGKDIESQIAQFEATFSDLTGIDIE